jgi:hypothetical protein
MQIHQIPGSVFLPQPPPLWYVTDGERSVGPIVTGQLVRHVEHGQVPDYCHVRVMRGAWRGLSAVREIAAFNSRVSCLPAALAELGAADLVHEMARIRDEEEFFHDLTQSAMTTTGAECAMLHCYERSVSCMITRCVIGPMPKDRLGRPLPEGDLVALAARVGRPVVGPPYGPTEDTLAKRFASSRGGVGAVAMMPISVGTKHSFMLELARPGHAFRRADLQRAERVVQRALRLRKN